MAYQVHYGVVPPQGTIAVHINPPLEDGETVSAISILPRYVTVQVMRADSVIVSNNHPRWPIVYTLVVLPSKPQLPPEQR